MKYLCSILIASFLAAPSFAEPWDVDTNALSEVLRLCIETSEEEFDDQTEDIIHATLENCSGLFLEKCLEDGGEDTTQGMAACAYAEADAWDILLNEYYKDAVESVKKFGEDKAGHDTTPEETFREAGRKWLEFREAECNMERIVFWGGSLESVQYAACFLDMTAERAIALYHSPLRSIWD